MPSDDYPVSRETRQRIAGLFPPESREEAASLLAQHAGRNLPLMANASVGSLERIWYAALKVSNGEIEGLVRAIDLAQLDWRDLLVEAGFAHDVHAHERWLPRGPAGSSPRD